MSTKEESGRRIVRAREALGLRLQDIAERCPGISVSRLSNWEQGRNQIGIDEAKKLATALGVSAAYILTLEDSPRETTEEQLIKLYRSADQPSQIAIFRVAESMAKYEVTPKKE